MVVLGVGAVSSERGTPVAFIDTCATLRARRSPVARMSAFQRYLTYKKTHLPRTLP